jgi:hypothetical protein
MINKYVEFEKWLLETFEEQFDDRNVNHLTKQAIFIAGWEARDRL